MMKIFGNPIPFEHDFRNFDLKIEKKRIEDHKAALKAHLQKLGYNGPLTGEVYKEPVADGYAEYMVGEGKRTLIMIHLPYYDAYQSPNVQYLPKTVIAQRIQQDKKTTEEYAAHDTGRTVIHVEEPKRARRKAKS